jgi:hypothetical protein
VIILIKFVCDCGNEDPGGFDIYVRQSDLCDILTVICKHCGEGREEYVACSRDAITLKK